MNEGYPKNWIHCMIRLNPETGEMHSDGDHSVRHWIESRLAKPAPKTLWARIGAAWAILFR